MRCSVATCTERDLVPGFDTHIVWVDMKQTDPRYGLLGAPVALARRPEVHNQPPEGVIMEVVARNDAQVLPLAVLDVRLRL